MEWHESDGVRWLQADLGGAGAAFGTRVGGVSAPPFDSLNLGILTEDKEAVVENRRRLAAALGLEPERIPIGLQVHGAELAFHSGPQLPSPYARPAARCPRSTAMSSPARPGAADPRRRLPPGGALRPGRGRDAALRLARPRRRHRRQGHQGCRRQRRRDRPRHRPLLLRSRPRGPHRLLNHLHSGRRAESRAGDKSAHRRLDLVEVARRLLVAAGVERIEAAGLCTSCEAELFFSHRPTAIAPAARYSLVRNRGRAGVQAAP